MAELGAADGKAGDFLNDRVAAAQTTSRGLGGCNAMFGGFGHWTSLASRMGNSALIS
jgi:hypothetical protein